MYTQLYSDCVYIFKNAYTNQNNSITNLCVHNLWCWMRKCTSIGPLTTRYLQYMYATVAVTVLLLPTSSLGLWSRFSDNGCLLATVWAVLLRAVGGRLLAGGAGGLGVYHFMISGLPWNTEPLLTACGHKTDTVLMNSTPQTLSAIPLVLKVNIKSFPFLGSTSTWFSPPND